jgi:putative Ca2+/H+ antiporter (TMEM165/GDT1 family)
VFLGSWLALSAVAAFGVLVGAWLQRKVPLWRIGVISGVLLALLAVLTVVELVRG